MSCCIYFKQKTAYEMRISDWSSDVCSSDLPDAVILELGANDGLRGLDPQATYDNLDAIMAKLTEAGLPVLIAGMLAPPNLGREYGETFNAVYPRLAEKYDSPLYPLDRKSTRLNSSH